MNETHKIDSYLEELGDWQQERLVNFRRIMHDVEPAIQEEWKWSVPIFSFNGQMISGMSAFKEHVKYNFFEGALLNDPSNLFNSGLDSKKHRSINLKEGEQLDDNKLRNLIEQAISLAK